LGRRQTQSGAKNSVVVSPQQRIVPLHVRAHTFTPDSSRPPLPSMIMAAISRVVGWASPLPCPDAHDELTAWLSAYFAFLLPAYKTFKALRHRPLSEPELERLAQFW
jgi:hypothetical protein